MENELELKVEGVSEENGDGHSHKHDGALVSVLCAQQIGILLAKVDLVPIKVRTYGSRNGDLQSMWPSNSSLRPSQLYSVLLGALHDAVSVYEMLARTEDGARYRTLHPAESGLYCRMVMVRVLLVLAKVNDNSDVQDMLMNITRNLVSAYVDKDAEGGSEVGGDKELVALTGVVEELLQGYSEFSDAALLKNIWLLPLLSKLIQCSNKSVRVIVHAIVSRLFDGPLSDLLAESEKGAR